VIALPILAALACLMVVVSGQAEQSALLMADDVG